MADLVSGGGKLDISLDSEQARQFVRYCETLLLATRRVNLTAVRSPAGIMHTLFLDSLTISPALPERLRLASAAHTPWVVDVGSGAGIPGIPLKIVYPHWSVELVESVGKKAGFLEMAVKEIGLGGVRVKNARAEELGRIADWRDAADLCLARAVAPLPALVELCGPLVRPGGLLAFPKSGDVMAETESAQAAAEALRVTLHHVSWVPEELGLGPDRAVVIYEKTEATPSGYPRRVGLAQVRPIGGPAGRGLSFLQLRQLTHPAHRP